MYNEKQFGENVASYLPGANPSALQAQPLPFRSFAPPHSLWSPQLDTQIRHLSQIANVSPAAMLMTALQILFYHYTGLEEIVLTYSFTNQPEIWDGVSFWQPRDAKEVRCVLTGETRLQELLNSTNEHLCAIHMDETLPPPSSPWQLQLGYALSASPSVTRDHFPDKTTEGEIVPSNVFLLLQSSPEEPVATLMYGSYVLDESALARLDGHLQTVLVAICTGTPQPIASLSLLTTNEYQRQVIEWNATERAYPSDQCLHQLIEAQVTRTPDALAVIFEQERLTYREMNERANQLAHVLQRLGVGPDCAVGVAMERSCEMVVALLGVLKAGGAYVPLDPALPGERLAFILEDLQAGTHEISSVLLTQSHLLDRLPEHNARVLCLDTDWASIALESRENLPCLLAPDNLAYIIYTSGSTGKPKGAMNTHRGICNRLLWMQDEYQLIADDCVLQKTPFSFDVSAWEFFWPLLAGARLAVARPEGHKDSSYLIRLIQKQQVTTLHFVPSMLQIFVDEPGLKDCTSLRQVICSGETLPYTLQERFFSRHEAALHNLYGPTEAAIDVTYWPCQRGSELAFVPIGYPIANTQIYILNAARKPVPVGIPGELYIGGVGVARGYLNRPELTAARFIDDPYSQRAGAKLYCTGDLARFLPDGAIEYLGRMDMQIKLRGFRIELGEVEAVLGQQPAVREAVVIVRNDISEDPRLVAYVVLQKDRPATVKDLREHMVRQVPEYMVPATFVVLDAFPLNPSGKVDRRALPAPTVERSTLSVDFVEPRTLLEAQIAETWAQVLHLEQVGVEDTFFSLGGHSLLAMLIISRLRQTLQVELALRDLFDAPTVAQLATRVAQLQNGSNAFSPGTPLFTLKRHLQPFPPSDETTAHAVAALPASFAQNRLWFLDQMMPGSAAYNIPATIRIASYLDVAILQRSIQTMIERHEVLRTTFAFSEGQLRQFISSTSDVPFYEIDLQILPPSAREAEVQRIAASAAARPFDLSQDSLLRLALLHLDKQDHMLVLVLHHIISDGWSIGLFFQELVELYTAGSTGRTAQLPKLPVQYADFAAWQQQQVQGALLEAQLAYWKNQLADASTVIELPTDRPRPALPTPRGATYNFTIPGNLTSQLKKLSEQSGATLYITLVAAFQILLHRYTGQDDLLLGTAVADRRLPEVQGLLGLFLNTLVLRTRFQEHLDVYTLLGRVRDSVLDAYAHQDLPFELLVNELHLERVPGQSPLFQVSLMLDPPTHLQRGPWHLTRMASGTGASKFDLSLELEEVPDGLIGHLEYSADLFNPSTIARLAEHWRTLLAGMVAYPAQAIGELPLLTEQEYALLLLEWNATRSTYPQDVCLHQLIAEQAERTPEALAVTYESTSMTYRELNEHANQLAHYLQTLGVGPDVLVAICVERSLTMLVGLLGILKAGGAYVPIDPMYPSERLAFMLEDAAVPLLLTQQSLLTQLPARQARTVCLDSDAAKISSAATTNPATDMRSAHLCYVIYTSGSTGRPKGVQIPHHAVVNFLLSMQKHPGLTPQDTLLAITTLSFDIAGLELYLPLLTGAHVVIASRDVATSGVALASLLETSQTTVMQATPVTWRLLLANGWRGKSDLKALCGGEALPVELARDLLPRVASLYNMYGPTETTIWSTLGKVESVENSISIGRPIANTRLAILDKYRQPVPVGVPGELYIGGDGLARGYLKRPELTNERFLWLTHTSEQPERFYRTGDLARYDVDGAVELIGRVDQQVKLRGFRIELGEIESVLEQDPSVQQAVVIVREDTPDNRQLVAYIQARERQEIATHLLRQHAQMCLPYYMIPSAIVVLASLPQTPNGKIDRRALPIPDLEHQHSNSNFVAPRNALEEVIAGSWSEVLEIQQIGIYDNFFTLGGHSLRALQVISLLRTSLQVELSLRSFFEAPTVSQLAELITRTGGITSGTSRPGPQRQPRPEQSQQVFTFPASSGQQGLWYLHQLAPENTAYNVFANLRLLKTLDFAALEESLLALTMRHEALRTTFVLREGQVLQVCVPQIHLPLSCYDLRSLEASERSITLMRLANEEFQRPFDLARGPLVRVMVLHLAEQEHLLLLTMHHSISDGWSLGLLLQELMVLYEAQVSDQPLELPEPALQAGDFAAWQQAHMQGAALEEHLTYWKNALAGAPFVLEMPTDYSRPSSPSQQGAQYTFKLSSSLTSALKTLGQREQVTPYMILVAAFQTLLQRYTGQQNIVLGTTTAGRTRAEFESTIGYFTNTQVLRSDFSDNPTGRVLLARVREAVLNAQLYQEMPFDLLVRELQPERLQGQSPLFQVFLTLDTPLPAHSNAWDLTQLDLETGANKFDISLDLSERSGCLVGHLEYRTDLFDLSTIERLANHWQRILQAMVDDPMQTLSAIPLLTEMERLQMLVEWNATAASYPRTQSIPQLFEEQVTRTPGASAVTGGGLSLTYQELNERSNQLAHYLRRHNVQPGQRVGISLDRSPEMLVGLLGILKAGGVYVPLDPTYPEERLAFMLEDAQITALVTKQGLLENVSARSTLIVYLNRDWAAIAQESQENLALHITGDDCAYMIYTSGSTGRPKGVLGTHQGSLNRFNWMWRAYPFADHEICCQKTTLNFVDSIWEIFGPLLSGVQQVIVPDEIVKDPARFLSTLALHRITRIVLVPSLLRMLLEIQSDLSTQLPMLKYWICSGEALSVELAELFYQRMPRGILLNLYGSSEVAADATYHEVKPGQYRNSIPIGRPIDNTRVYLLDLFMQPVPPGVAGELYIGGDGLARGYFNRPELNREKFVVDPFSTEPGARLYKTGDRARYLADGTLEYLGRLDQQVKLRGMRIELEEIEALLREHHTVRDAAVTVREDIPGDQRLVAHVVLQSEQQVTANALQHHLSQHVPGYMIPGLVIFLPTLPLTPNGKVNRHALPAPDYQHSPTTTTYVAPERTIHYQLLQIWEELLGVRPIGICDNFFALGGHSLLAARLMTRIAEVCGKTLPISTLFNSATIEELANILQEEARERQTRTVVTPVQACGSRRPFFFLHGDWNGKAFYCLKLARELGQEQPFYLLEPYVYDGLHVIPSLEQVAAAHITAMRAIQPEGPYLFGGWCNGAMVAYEMACQLRAQQQGVELLILMDAGTSSPFGTLLYRLLQGGNVLLRLKPEQKATLFFRLLHLYEYIRLWNYRRKLAEQAQLERPPEEVEIAHPNFASPWPPAEHLRDNYMAIFNWLASGYAVRPYGGNIAAFWAEEDNPGRRKVWECLLSREIHTKTYFVPGTHMSSRTRHIDALARSLRECIEENSSQSSKF